MKINWSDAWTPLATLFGGGGALGFLRLYSDRRAIKAEAELAMMGSAEKLVEMLRADVAETRARCDAQDEQIALLKSEVNQLSRRQDDLLAGCAKLTDQLRQHDIKPVWEPPKS